MSKNVQAVPSYLRELNERRVLDVLRAQGSAHAAEVARMAGLSRPTASQVLRSLIDVGLVEEQDPAESDPRRARAMYSAVSDIGVVLVIDIGARFIRAAVADLNGEVRATFSQPVADPKLPNLLAAMHKAVDQVLAESDFKLADVLSVVVGSPGIVDAQTGEIAIAGTISDLEGLRLAEVVAKEFGHVPVVENDVNLVTLAEQQYGEGKEVSNFAVLSVGSGVGAGLSLNGQLYRGSRGAAGEVFYIPFGAALAGRRGSVDPSAANIVEIANALAADYKETRLQPPYTPVAIFEATRHQDPLALAVVDEVARRIALYISAVTAVLDLELVVLSGGIGRQADVLLAAIRAVVAKLVPFAPRVEVSALGEQAVLLGGVALGSSIAQDIVFAQRSAAYAAARDIGESTA